MSGDSFSTDLRMSIQFRRKIASIPTLRTQKEVRCLESRKTCLNFQTFTRKRTGRRSDRNGERLAVLRKVGISGLFGIGGILASGQL